MAGLPRRLPTRSESRIRAGRSTSASTAQPQQTRKRISDDSLSLTAGMRERAAPTLKATGSAVALTRPIEGADTETRSINLRLAKHTRAGLFPLQNGAIGDSQSPRDPEGNDVERHDLTTPDPVGHTIHISLLLGTNLLQEGVTLCPRFSHAHVVSSGPHQRSTTMRGSRIHHRTENASPVA
jgi:hypothetical protein